MSSRRKRIRAHANPLATNDIIPPSSPDEYDWSDHYPAYITPHKEGVTEQTPERHIQFADIGCGFGGLLHTLSPLYPDKMILGLEIRPRVVEIVEKSIKQARTTNEHVVVADDVEIISNTKPTPYHNISVIRSNIMKFVPNYFKKGQLEKMFFLFPDPHFKRSKYRLRVINPLFVDYYAYAIKEGGILYTITDVEDLHLWMKQHLDEHPLFERIENEDLKDDPCFEAIHSGTQEGQKVSRNHGDKWPAVYRRVAYDPARPNKKRTHLLE